MKRQDKVYIEIDGYSKKPFKLLDENNKPIIIDKKEVRVIETGSHKRKKNN